MDIHVIAFVIGSANPLFIYSFANTQMCRYKMNSREQDRDDLLIKFESPKWVLFVIFAIKNERMVVI